MDELFVLLIAIFVDRILGEPPRFLHTTVWMGGFTGYLKDKIPDELLSGFFIFLAISVPFLAFSYFLIHCLEGLVKILVAGILLKLQFSWKALEEHAFQVARSFEESIEKARKSLSRIVGRDTKNLDKKGVISGTVESVAESNVDGIVAPLFYFGIASPFGIEAAVCAAVFYRTVNTLDSMIGYPRYKIGTFSAKLDDVLNFIPARITAILIALSSFPNWRNALKVLLRDRGKTPSPNSGYPMAAMAGALGVKLEKKGFYSIGKGELFVEHIFLSVRIVNVATILFLTGLACYVAFA